MELNDPIRNRRVGFLGVAVATLLTPGGKLFTSAMAAMTVAAVVGMNMSSKETPSGLSVSPIHTGPLETSGEMLDISDLATAGDTHTLSAETLVSDPNAASGNPAAFTSQNMPSTNIAASNIAGMDVSNISGGSGPTVLPPQIFPPRDKETDPKKPKCTVVLVGELASNTELAGDEVICLEDDKLAEKNGNPEPESVNEPVSDTKPVSEPIVIALGSPSKPEPELTMPEYVGPSPEETSPANSTPVVERQLFQPLISVAAVPEPTTLALFLLGLLGFAQIYRKNKYL